MTPDKLVEELTKAGSGSLKSVVLYGSAAAGDHAGKNSDYNVLVIAEELGVETLNAFSKTATAWAKAGNPAPLLFTQERLKQATDVFPIELLDIRECHKILYGDDVVSDLEIGTENLRLQIEHELRGSLIKLRQAYLLTGGKSKAVADLMVESLSTFLVLFRASLRLFADEIPQKKFQALEKLGAHLSFDPSVFQTVQQLKDGTKKAKSCDVETLFNTYLTTIECVIDAVDAEIHKGVKS
ncbi:nucleotidyltransferase domain-containing protein [Pontiella agarivorans]|uniref:Nucleotidyltransferase domain-containing protein n=1 Tax=Pontiella agarivorans TaxID=3038953 RepID=A0ABU5MWD5_9BACT|nr:nucleotidyltransferase domain-containing protein [Pontiella agarivorans]MDZ8118523.1 nucleotidyltransferase domain-containing protein [Pontiella agarivorans]